MSGSVSLKTPLVRALLSSFLIVGTSLKLALAFNLLMLGLAGASLFCSLFLLKWMPIK